MIKLIGALLIVAATTWIGFRFAKKISERPRQIRLLRTALQSLDAEIMYGHTPLQEAAERLAKQIPNPVCSLFQYFGERLERGNQTVREAWRSSVDDVWSSTALKQTEREVMEQFGETLGQHDRISQQKHIQLCLTHLEREEGEAKDAQLRYEKMMKSLGVLTGLLIVILLY